MIEIPLAFTLFCAVVTVAVVSLYGKHQKRTRYQQELRQWWAQNPDPQQPWQTPPPPRPARSGWSMAGTALAAIVAAGGLTILALVVLVFVALSTGSVKFGNK